MEKKVTISHNTLKTGFLLITTLIALTTDRIMRNQKSICVALMLVLEVWLAAKKRFILIVPYAMFNLNQKSSISKFLNPKFQNASVPLCFSKFLWFSLRIRNQ